MTKKVGLIALFLFCLGLTGQAQMMYVKEKNGIRTNFAINNIKKLTFSAGNFAVSKIDGNTEVFALSGIRYLNFTDISAGVYPLEKQTPESQILFPNPVKDILTIKYKTLSKALQFDVMTLDGKTIYQQTINIQSGINQTDINISSLPIGMYLCRLNDGKAVLISKFLKY